VNHQKTLTDEILSVRTQNAPCTNKSIGKLRFSHTFANLSFFLSKSHFSTPAKMSFDGDEDFGDLGDEELERELRELQTIKSAVRAGVQTQKRGNFCGFLRKFGVFGADPSEFSVFRADFGVFSREF
jgi:hypothetical protein